jgi:hypothetical protein
MKPAVQAVSAALLAAAVLASVVPAINHILEVDACLERGRVYDYTARVCRDDIVSSPVPRPGENLDYVSSGIAFFVVVVTASVAAALDATRLRSFRLLRRVIRWAGAALLVAYALAVLNHAAHSAWLSGGPPMLYPHAWWGQAVRSFWLSVTMFLAAIWLVVALRPTSKARAHNHASVGGQSAEP